jgi:hypothetical protein
VPYSLAYQRYSERATSLGEEFDLSISCLILTSHLFRQRLFRQPWPYVVSRLSVILTLLPVKLLLKVLFWSWPSTQLEPLAQLVTSKDVIFATLTMADEEMETVTQLDSEFLRSRRETLRAYFATKDGWVADVERDIIAHCLGAPEQVVVDTAHGVTHAFCISMWVIWITSGDF